MKFIKSFYRKSKNICEFLYNFIKYFKRKNSFITNTNYIFDNKFIHKPNSKLDPLKSQKGQVRFVLENVFNYSKNGLKREGFFIDLAAGHPTNFSNTYFLENKLNWKGILIEANPYFLQLLKEKRDNIIVENAVFSESNINLDFRIDNFEFGGIVGDEFDNNLRIRGKQIKSQKLIKVKTKTLEEILDYHKAPSIMDYLSLDIEGAEWEALKNFNFEKYKWKCLTIEKPKLELDLLLDKNGYIQVCHSYFDTFYIHKDFIEDANLFNLFPKFLTTEEINY